MGEQVHRRFTDEQVKMVLGRCLAKELRSFEAIELLGLKRRQFFEWVQRYRREPDGFSVSYRRKRRSRRLDDAVDRHIIEELADPYQKVDLRIVPMTEAGLVEVRFWHNGRLVSIQKIKTGELPIVRV